MILVGIMMVLQPNLTQMTFFSFQTVKKICRNGQLFILELNIELNPKNCEMLIIGKNLYLAFSLTDETIVQTSQVDYFSKKKLIEYLDALLGKRKICQMKWYEKQLYKMKKKETF
jgi:hypothetical protein